MNKIINKKNIFEKDIQKGQNEINSINQKEIEFNNNICFMPNDIKKKDKNLNILRKRNEYLDSHINSCTQEISKINKMNNDFNTIKRNHNENNYENNYSFNKIKEDINYLKNRIEKELDNINNNRNLIFVNANFNIQDLNNDSEFIIQDFFVSNQSNNDPTYNKFKIYEKNALTTYFLENRRNIENIILNEKYLNQIQNLNNNLINKIIDNEGGYDFYREKIIKKIESIINDEEEYKIEHLTILLVGRKGVGKTTLIKYILDLNSDNKKIYSENFKVYISQKVKYLKLIEVKGIGFDEDSTPQNIQKNIKSYIDKLMSKNSQNYNDVIHCIWYCISGPRFEEGEIALFKELKKLYKETIMPMIIVFTKATDKSLAKKMEENLKNEKKIDNSFVTIMAEDITLVNGKVKKAFGKEELIKITLSKCTEALGSDMMKIMVDLISKNIKDIFLKENENNIQMIKNQKLNDFFENYKKVLDDGEFIMYIVNLFFKYLKFFYGNDKAISNRSKNLIIKSDFISTIKNIYSSYQGQFEEEIEPFVKEQSIKFIELQVFFEKSNSNMEFNNRRNLSEFEETTQIFLKRNIYFMIQNYIINHLINQQNNPFDNYITFISQKFNSIIQSLINFDANNNNQDSTQIKQHLEYCFKRKLHTFSENNIFLNNSFNIEIKKPSDFSHYNPNSRQNYNKDEKLDNSLNNLNSFIFHKNKFPNYKSIKKNEPKKNWFIYKEINWKFLDENSRIKLNYFLEEMKYQDSSLKLDNNDNIFILLLKEIKNDLINYINDNISQYIKEIFDNYNSQNYNNKFYNYKNNEIQEIIRNESIEFSFKEKIHDSLSQYDKNEYNFDLKKITIIITGKSGVGKSTLINCLLKENLAREGVGDVVTIQSTPYKNDKVPFISLIDTRGYELEKKYNPSVIKNEVLRMINVQKEQNNYNDYIQCIWYCVNGSGIDDSEKNALKELIKNKYDVPVIVVFSNAQKKTEVQSMEKQIKTFFPLINFIPVLGRGIEDVESFGLNELIDLTLNTIKSNNKNDMFKKIKSEYITKEENLIKEEIIKIETNIINKLAENFISDFNSVLDERKFKENINDSIEKIIMAFSLKNNIKETTKLLVKNTNKNIKNIFQKYIEFYSETAEGYINEIVDNKSLDYLDLQVKIEQLSKGSIKTQNKKNRKEFEKIIKSFCKDNFHYVAQKFLVYRLIKDLFEVFSEKLGENILSNINKFLSSDEVMKDYMNIYLNIFGEYEKIINEYKNKNNGKIYD